MNDRPDKAYDNFRKVYNNSAYRVIVCNKSKDCWHHNKHTVHSVIESVCKYGITAGQSKHIRQIKQEDNRLSEPDLAKHNMYDSNYIVSRAKNQSHKQRIQNNYQLFLNIYFHLSQKVGLFHKPGEKSPFFVCFPAEIINAVKFSNDNKLTLFRTETFDF